MRSPYRGVSPHGKAVPNASRTEPWTQEVTRWVKRRQGAATKILEHAECIVKDSRAIKPPSGLLSKGPDSPSNDRAGGYSLVKPVISTRISR